MTTVRDLAKLTGISIATISLVLNDKHGVSAETRERILAAIRDTGYVVKPARVPRLRKRRTIRLLKMRGSGLLVERNEEFITRLLDGIIHEATENRYELVVSNMSLNAGPVSFADACSAQDAGVIVLATEMPLGMRPMLAELTRPYIILDNELHKHNDNAVTMNNEEAAFLAARHLFDLGHRRIGFITSRNPAENLLARERGLLLAAEEMGFRYDKRYRIMLPHDLENAEQETPLPYLDAPDYPTAFFAANDMLALTAMRILKQAGKRIPEDYSIVGMDNLRSCAIASPQLTTITLPNEVMGRTAVQRLISLLETPIDAAMKTFIGCDLLVRASTAAYHDNT